MFLVLGFIPLGYNLHQAVSRDRIQQNRDGQKTVNDHSAAQVEPEVNGAGKSRLTVTKLLPLLLLAGLVAAFFGTGLNRYLSFEALRDHREDLLGLYEANKLLAIVGFMLIYALVVALSVPGATWMTLAGGFLFGTFQATLYVVTAATLGSLAVFLLAKYCLADFFRAKAGKSIEKMERGFASNALSYLLFLRLVPLFPFWLVNLVPAFLGVSTRTFVIGTLVGIVPGTAVFCSVGNGLGAVFDSGGTPDLKIIFQPEILGPILALAVLSLVPILYKKYKGTTP